MTAETVNLMEAARLGDNDACTQLLHENSGLIWSMVRRYARRNVEMEDLYQLGCLGFLKAVRGFDPAFGTQFSTYAVPKIAGEIRRFLRDDGLLKVSRGIKERAFLIRQAHETLYYTLGREPTISELAAETSLTIEEIAATDLATSSVASLQAENGEEGSSLENILGTESLEDSLLERVDLRRAIDHLPEQQQQVILLRYFRGLTQDATARVLRISQVQVSRLEKKSIQFLYRELSP